MCFSSMSSRAKPGIRCHLECGIGLRWQVALLALALALLVSERRLQKHVLDSLADCFIRCKFASHGL